MNIYGLLFTIPSVTATYGYISSKLTRLGTLICLTASHDNPFVMGLTCLKASLIYYLCFILFIISARSVIFQDPPCGSPSMLLHFSGLPSDTHGKLLGWSQNKSCSCRRCRLFPVFPFVGVMWGSCCLSLFTTYVVSSTLLSSQLGIVIRTNHIHSFLYSTSCVFKYPTAYKIYHYLYWCQLMW